MIYINECIRAQVFQSHKCSGKKILTEGQKGDEISTFVVILDIATQLNYSNNSGIILLSRPVMDQFNLPWIYEYCFYLLSQ